MIIGERELVLRGLLGVVDLTNRPKIDGLISLIPPSLISERILLAGDSLTSAPCLNYATILRDCLQQDFKINDEEISFRSIRLKDGRWSHVWLDFRGGVIDSPEFARKFWPIYRLGRDDANLNEKFKELEELGLHDQLLGRPVPALEGRVWYGH